MKIPLGELSSLTIPQLSAKYGIKPQMLMEMREEAGMTREQRLMRKWDADKMIETLQRENDLDAARLYGLPTQAIKMIRNIVGRYGDAAT